MTRIAAVILAGGKGQRLGGANKALLTLGNERFLDRALAVTEGCAPRLLAIGQNRIEVPGDVIPIADLDTDYAGPLAGVAAAVAELNGDAAELLLTLAVDTPLFPTDFVARALPLLDRYPAVLAAYGGQDYPTNALWRLEAIAHLPTDVRAGTAPRSLMRLAEGIGATRIDYAASSEIDPFRNANTPEDLSFLRFLAQQRRDR